MHPYLVARIGTRLFAHGIDGISTSSIKHVTCTPFRFRLSLSRAFSTSVGAGDCDDDAKSGDVFEKAPSLGSESDSSSSLPALPGKGPPPDEPPGGLCCMSGCANCVWLEHAKELIEYYEDGGDMAEKALEQLTDPSMKAFLRFELDFLKRIKDEE